ncbi:MAG: L,D-transpeptidase family protein [Hyphomicrobium aestuarii]|nr:L,D-transpeptidase family protein [Hyphomicrobium aestuarii]
MGLRRFLGFAIGFSALAAGCTALTHSVVAQNRGPATQSPQAVELANIGPVEPVSPVTHIPSTPQPLTPLTEAIADALKAQPKLLATDPASAASDFDYAAAVAFYTARGFEPIWISQASTTAGRLTPRARAAVDELQRAADWGLDPADFPTAASTATIEPSPEALAKVELTLTGMTMKYARHARGGRIISPEMQLSGFIDRRPNLIEPARVLAALGSDEPADKVLTGFHPKHQQFELLRQAYLKTRGTPEIAADRILPEKGPMLAPGKRHADIAILRRRLGVAAPDTSGPDWMDSALASALRTFQRSAGLKADAVIGEQTRRALNDALGSNGLGSNAPRLLANMEAWRWMPDGLGDTRVEVNIPEQQFRFYRNGALVHTERVIVGKMETATPLFSDEMETVVFQPTWGVPNSIKVAELLPDLQSGNGLRAGLKMTLNGRSIDPFKVDWRRADIKNYMVFQPSGDDNALGDVKFLFPNQHAVYMHDTPNRRLFKNAQRLYSHGCVRVRNPMRFAELLLETDRGLTPKEVRKIANDGPEDNKVKLTAKIPVHITYFTAIADQALNVATAPDLYGHEKRITLALQGQFNKIKKLDPPVIVPGKPAPRREIARAPRQPRYADGFADVGGQGVRVNGRYPPPTALGYYRAQQQWGFFAQPPQSSERSSGRSRGTSPNDTFMRSLMNGP